MREITKLSLFHLLLLSVVDHISSNEYVDARSNLDNHNHILNDRKSSSLRFIPLRPPTNELQQAEEYRFGEVYAEDRREDLRKSGLLHSYFSILDDGSQPLNDIDQESGKENSIEDDLKTFPWKGEEVIEVTVDADYSIFTVSEEFLSFTVDYELFYEADPWAKFNISSPRLVTLLKGLSPAIWRIGGSGSSSMFFNIKPERLVPAKLIPQFVSFPKDALVGFIKASVASGNRFLLDLNQQSRFCSQWDPANALEMLEFLVSHGFGENIDFELGNEPEYSTPDRGQLLLKPDEVGNDYLILERVIRSYPEFSGSRIVGPDCVGVAKGSLGTQIMNRVASIAGHAMRAITFHQYYFEGTKATVKDYVDPRYFAALEETIHTAQSAVATSQHPLLPLWIGETSDSWHSGTANVSDRYVSGFLWLDKLGLSARMGIEVIMRQTFYCGNYGLVADYLQPNPDYWLSLLHKHLVGRNVLNVVLSNREQDSDNDEPPTTRVYAHCTRLTSGGLTPTYPRGSVTLFALNVSPNKTKSLQLPQAWRSSSTDLYLLMPPGGDLVSQQVLLNGKELKLVSDTQLPQLTPQTLPPQQSFSLPPLTFGFLVIPHANAKACL